MPPQERWRFRGFSGRARVLVSTGDLLHAIQRRARLEPGYLLIVQRVVQADGLHFAVLVLDLCFHWLQVEDEGQFHNKTVQRSSFELRNWNISPWLANPNVLTILEMAKLNRRNWRRYFTCTNTLTNIVANSSSTIFDRLYLVGGKYTWIKSQTSDCYSGTEWSTSVRSLLKSLPCQAPECSIPEDWSCR